ncbi:type VII secretion system-associated protein [Streptomyces sp. NPDC056930]|uniref:type VII secretion system-associated protein n=1 Tax=Streptomyces sp. NPDC056930 TaxID=3345967 RepID=UPI003640214F
MAETPERDEPLTDVPESILEAARAAPDHWFGMVDPAWRGEDTPPVWAVVGQYRSDADGEVVEWQYNDDYRPSPSANGWSAPTDPVDEAIQLAATGYGPEDEVFRLLADAEVGVMLAPDGSSVEACSPDGTPVVPVFTSDPQLWSGGRYAARTVPVRDLVRELDEEIYLYVNPAGAVSMTVAPGQLATETVAEQPVEATAAAPQAEPDTGVDDDAPPTSESSASDPSSDPSSQRPDEPYDPIRRVETVSLPDAEPGLDGEPDTEPDPEPDPEPDTEQDPDPDPDPDGDPRNGSRTPVSSTQEHLVNILSGGAG